MLFGTANLNNDRFGFDKRVFRFLLGLFPESFMLLKGLQLADGIFILLLHQEINPTLHLAFEDWLCLSHYLFNLLFGH